MENGRLIPIRPQEKSQPDRVPFGSINKCAALSECDRLVRFFRMMPVQTRFEHSSGIFVVLQEA